ncbi:7-carboxy-7-deazaguanine synthase [Allohahella marinimesophila]|uniref:7-carboxy-7-deazaguanine synthase n=1 Tax=Allohahella marinimesophila TaxID=1054972 RepID=A0ABP7P8F2_9GAMM
MSAYRVKEAFYTLQGEGANQGRPAVFCRFSKCNLWNGREADRASAVCNFCDTDFVGVDGQNGGTFADAGALADHLIALWPSDFRPAFIVCTGGEPFLQLDDALVAALHDCGFEIAVETNGTLLAPAGIDWLCVSPKGRSTVVIDSCDELKFVYPQADLSPEDCVHIQADHYYLSPRDDRYLTQPGTQEELAALRNASLIATSQRITNHTAECVEYCMSNPPWKLSLQTHKYLGID